jgi:hypothetical protein
MPQKEHRCDGPSAFNIPFEVHHLIIEDFAHFISTKAIQVVIPEIEILNPFPQCCDLQIVVK